MRRRAHRDLVRAGIAEDDEATLARLRQIPIGLCEAFRIDGTEPDLGSVEKERARAHHGFRQPAGQKQAKNAQGRKTCRWPVHPVWSMAERRSRIIP